MIKGIVESIVDKLQSPQPGSHFVQSIAAALDAGETQITQLKGEQRQHYDDLSREAGCCTLLLRPSCSQMLCT